MDNGSQKPGLIKKQLILAIAVIVIVIAAALVLMMRSTNREQAIDTGTQEDKSTKTVEEYDSGTKVEEPQQPPLEQPEITNASTHTVAYTSMDCYEPVSQTINIGDTVTFANNDVNGEYMWPASDSHPSHTIYPEFDAKRAIAPGGTYSFTFTKKGSWAYHDHLKSNCGGTITVQ